MNIEDYGLGRIIIADPRDRKFLAAPLVEDTPIEDQIRYHNANGWWGNQESRPQCVGYSLTHTLQDGPITHKGPKPILAPHIIYNEAQKIDEWEGENYDGTSVRAGAKYLQSIGFISEYRWAWDVFTLAKFIISTGPAVVGTYWYEDMFFPDKAGFIKIGGRIAGGHAYKVDGVNMKRRIFRIKNSWGRNWGKKGFAYISFDDMGRLIQEYGEVCMLIEVKDLPKLS